MLYPFEHVGAYGLLGGRAHVPLSVWVRTSTVQYTTNTGDIQRTLAIYNDYWSGDICEPAYHHSCSYALTIPPPHTLPYYPLNIIPRDLFPS